MRVNLQFAKFRIRISMEHDSFFLAMQTVYMGFARVSAPSGLPQMNMERGGWLIGSTFQEAHLLSSLYFCSPYFELHY